MGVALPGITETVFMVVDDSSDASGTLLPQHVLLGALRTAPQAMVIADAEQTIIFVNNAFTALTGYAPAELLGHNCRMLQGPDSDAETLGLMRSCLAAGQLFEGQVLNYRKDGTSFWNALNISPVRGNDGVVSHFISIQSDITPPVTSAARAASVSTCPSTPDGSSQTALHYRQRLVAGGLRMHMQPIIDLRTGGTHFFEALARLELEDGTLVLPGAFLPLLTEAEVTLLFRQALEQVLGQLAEWDRAGLHMNASINLAPATLSEPDCARWVSAGLKRHGISPQRLGIELLETKVLHDKVQLETFSELRSLGVGLAMDDLGSAYSGLGRLLKLPFQTVKVDVGIVAQMRNRPIPTLTMLTTLIQMGRDQEWDIIIEGLEDAGLTEVARILGATYGQGFYLCRPVPADDIAAWLTQPSRLPDCDVVRTQFGALAYHWKSHRVRAPHAPAYEECPITDLLVEQADPMAIEWHHQQHDVVEESRASSEMLLAWMVERCKTND
ncbi:EAL domain-containing protein [Tessaracoccus sp.]